MTIIFGFIVPIILFIISLVVKTSVKTVQETIRSLQDDKKSDSGLGKLLSKNKVLSKIFGKSKDTNESIEIRSLKAVVQSGKNLVKLLRGTALIIFGVSFFVLLIVMVLFFVFVGSIISACSVVLFQKDKEDEEKEDKKQGITNTVPVEEEKESHWQWIGDIQIGGMALAVGEDSENISNFGESDFYSSDDISLDWLKDSWDAIEDELSSLSKKNIVFLMGISDLSVDNAKKYAEYYNSLSDDITTSNNIMIIGVLPVGETNNKDIKNKDIKEFNEKLKSELTDKVHYIDAYTYIMETLDEDDNKEELNNDLLKEDGIIYTDDIYKEVKVYIETFGVEYEDEDEDDSGESSTEVTTETSTNDSLDSSGTSDTSDTGGALDLLVNVSKVINNIAN